MTTNIAARAPLIFEAIKTARKILLHCHPGPDPDSYGSALALYHYLRGLGKEVVLIKGDSPIPDFAQFLPGAEAVTPKNYLEINPGEFDLFMILDVSAPDRVSGLGPVIFPETLNTVLIDHHATNAPFAKINLVDPDYPATAAILYDLLTAWGAAISREMALCLLIGLYFDTGGFKYAATKPATLRAAARLAEIAPDYTATIFKIENNNSPEAIRFQGLALTSVQTYFEDRVALAALAYEQIKAAGLAENDSKSVTIANILKSVRGWEIGLSLFEWEPGMVKLSSRTRDPENFNLAKFIVLLGGGGHPAAAGTHLALPLAKAKEAVLAALAQAYPQLIDKPKRGV